MVIWLNFVLWGLSPFLYYHLYQRLRGRYSFVLNLLFLVSTFCAGVGLIFLETPNVLHGDGEISEDAFLYFIPFFIFAALIGFQLLSFAFTLLTQAARQPIVQMIAQPIERLGSGLSKLIGQILQIIFRGLNFLLFRPLAFILRHLFNVIGWIFKLLSNGLDLLKRPLVFVARQLFNALSWAFKILVRAINFILFRPVMIVLGGAAHLLIQALRLIGGMLNFLVVRPGIFVTRGLNSLVARGAQIIGRGLNALLIRPLAFVIRNLFIPFEWLFRVIGSWLNILFFKVNPILRNLILVTVMLAVVGGVAVWNYSEGNLCSWWDLGPQTQCHPRSCEPLLTERIVEICFYSSNTKEDWIREVTDTFNSLQFKTASGKIIVVKVVHVTSGGSQKDILEKKIIPTAWSPGDQSWANDADQIWRDLNNGHPLIGAACQPTIYAPIGFGMWQPMAQALGWPNQPISWNTLITLANDPKGWATYGHPEWGQFKFGHTHPDYSNSGLLSMTSLAYDILNLTQGLTLEQVNSAPVIQAMSKLELQTYHYGVQTRDLITLMVRRGPSYLHAINTSEAEILKANRSNAHVMRFPLTFIFPAKGTFWSEQPYCIIDAAWVTTEQQEGARLYRDYLLKPEQQSLAIKNGLRPLDPTIPLYAPIALENGTDPRTTPQTVPALTSPTPNVTGAIRGLFYQNKKKATIVIVVDISGSMSGEKIANAVEATINFLKRLHPDDEVSIIVFSDKARELPLSGKASDIVEKLAPMVRELTATGQTALYDSVCLAVERTDAWQKAHQTAGDKRLYGVVILSDGEDTTSLKTKTAMFNCLPTGEDVEGIKVFTIAYGKDADKALLKQIADHTNGRTFSGDPSTIEQVYLAISAEQ